MTEQAATGLKIHLTTFYRMLQRGINSSATMYRMLQRKINSILIVNDCYYSDTNIHNSNTIADDYAILLNVLLNNC